jgi:hypothetical protein
MHCDIPRFDTPAACSNLIHHNSMLHLIAADTTYCLLLPLLLLTTTTLGTPMFMCTTTTAMFGDVSCTVMTACTLVVLVRSLPFVLHFLNVNGIITSEGQIGCLEGALAAYNSSLGVLVECVQTVTECSKILLCCAQHLITHTLAVLISDLMCASYTKIAVAVLVKRVGCARCSEKAKLHA